MARIDEYLCVLCLNFDSLNGHYWDPAFIFATMLLNRVKHSLADLLSTSSAMAIHRSLVGMEPGNFFMAASI